MKNGPMKTLVNREKLLALRNALDDVLAELPQKPARTRQTKQEKLMQHFEKLYGNYKHKNKTP
jgi:hypothetical protein